ncbi:hypothetical protein AMK31_18535 [Streptomyces sp. TSRI0107]|nr:hypothetical protein AMK31_18535 [Streptomyces sp. TSRI0107]
MKATTFPVGDSVVLSAECTLAKRPEYQGLHRECRRTDDIPLPHGRGILLQPRCGCSCHPWAGCS